MQVVRSARRLLRPRRVLWILCACALAFAHGAAAQGRNGPRFRRLVQQASEAYNRNEPDVAINLLEQAYAANPAPLLLYNIARAHTLAGRLERAVEYYDRFLAERPDEAPARLGREARATALSSG